MDRGRYMEAAEPCYRGGSGYPEGVEKKLQPQVYGYYGPKKQTTASIPMATRATKIRAPATALSPVFR